MWLQSQSPMAVHTSGLRSRFSRLILISRFPLLIVILKSIITFLIVILKSIFFFANVRFLPLHMRF